MHVEAACVKELRVDPSGIARIRILPAQRESISLLFLDICLQRSPEPKTTLACSWTGFANDPGCCDPGPDSGSESLAGNEPCRQRQYLPRSQPSRIDLARPRPAVFHSLSTLRLSCHMAT